MFSWSNQISYTIMIFIISLSKPTSRDSHYSCLIHHIQTIHKIWRNLLSFSGFESFLRKVDSGKSVHSSLNRLAGGICHLCKSFCEEQRSLFESIRNRIFLLVECGQALGRFSSFFGRINHQISCNLADGVSAELY